MAAKKSAAAKRTEVTADEVKVAEFGPDVPTARRAARRAAIQDQRSAD